MRSGVLGEGNLFGALTASDILLERRGSSVSDIYEDISLANAVIDFLGGAGYGEADVARLEGHALSRTKVIDAGVDHFQVRVLRDQELVARKRDILPPLKRVDFQLFLAITFVAEVRFAGSSVLAHPVAA